FVTRWRAPTRPRFAKPRTGSRARARCWARARWPDNARSSNTWRTAARPWRMPPIGSRRSKPPTERSKPRSPPADEHGRCGSGDHGLVEQTQALGEHARQVAEQLGPGVGEAPANSLEGLEVEPQHHGLFLGHDVRAPHLVSDERHLADGGAGPHHGEH